MDTTVRFSGRANDYVNYRPTYPVQIAGWLDEQVGLNGTTVADIGCGTGMWTVRLLEQGAKVLGIEPNDDMRAACQAHPNLTLIKASAAETGLDDASLQGVTAAQAAHWFEPESTRAEWKRITKPGGWWGILWNHRLRESEAEKALQAVYDHFRKPEDAGLGGRPTNPEELPRLLQGMDVTSHTVYWQERLSFDHLIGRGRSISFMPQTGELFEEFEQLTYKLVEEHGQAGELHVRMHTTLYLARV